MGFLDNSGDIILDAVLTDAGRKRLARGDGTFKVTKYAFGDDEIDYGKYKPNQASGSAYYDLEILQTPILEAFTNNRSSLKSKLISLTNNNLLFLPVIVLNDQYDHARPTEGALGSGSFYVAVDQTTATDLGSVANAAAYRCMLGQLPVQSAAEISSYIRVDQGLNTTKLTAQAPLSPELTEQQYMVEIDNRLGQLVNIGIFGGGATSGLASPAFIDDDQIATYYLTENVGGFIERCTAGALGDTGAKDSSDNKQKKGAGEEIIPGPRGTKLAFSLYAKDNLRQSDYLFDTIGETKTNPTLLTGTYKVISTTVRVTGVTTGYRIDIPVTFVKKTSS